MGVLPRAAGEGGWDDIMQNLERATAGVSDMTGGVDDVLVGSESDGF